MANGVRVGESDRSFAHDYASEGSRPATDAKVSPQKQTAVLHNTPPMDAAAHAYMPPHLIEELLRGNVVAFLGAGFSRPAGLPLWGSLIEGIAVDHKDSLDVESMAIIKALANSPSSNDLDLAAQVRWQYGRVRAPTT